VGSVVDQLTLAKEVLAKRIAGEIVLAPDAGKAIQKWRNIFKISQRRLADEIAIMPSVISDYENGRRKSPGIKVIKKLVDAMISIEEKVGGRIIKEFSEWPTRNLLSEAVLDLREFSAPISVRDFCSAINSVIIAREDLLEAKLLGYTVIDSMKAIIEIPPLELVKLYGLTTERALIFTGTRTGKSCMVAIKVTNLRPGLVVLHGSQAADELAKRIATTEAIPLAISRITSIDELLTSLRKISG
jgi:putative transcriptional regulator